MRLGAAQLSIGAQGAEVKQIQQILQGQGYQVGPVDGIYGPQTQAAVQAFQKLKGLLPDGIVGPLTWQALQGQPPAPAVSLPASPASPGPSPRPGGRGLFGFLDGLSMPMILGMVGLVALVTMGKSRR